MYLKSFKLLRLTKEVKRNMLDKPYVKQLFQKNVSALVKTKFSQTFISQCANFSILVLFVNLK